MSDNTSSTIQSLDGATILLNCAAERITRDYDADVILAFYRESVAGDLSNGGMRDFASAVVNWYDANMAGIRTKSAASTIAAYQEACKNAKDVLAAFDAHPEWLVGHPASSLDGGRPRLVFVSHSHDDAPYAKALVELLRHMGCDQTNVFCSSYRGYGIGKRGSSVTEELRQRFRDYDLFVIFLLSKEHYYQSEFSLNEMGAAWVLKSDSVPILLPGTSERDMRGVVTSDIGAIPLDDPGASTFMIDLMEDIADFLGLSDTLSSSDKARDVDDFLGACKSVV